MDPRRRADLRPLGAFVTDLDRTLAPADGRITPAARATLARARSLRLAVILASGRPYRELVRLTEGVTELDALVAENGAVVDAPRGTLRSVEGETVAARVRERLVMPPAVPFEPGEVIVSVRSSDADEVRWRVLGLPVDWILNVDRVMIVPAGVSKSAGVARAMRDLGLVGRSYAAVGDGENDVELLQAARLSAAVANAVPEAAAVATYRCRASGADGVAEFLSGPVAALLGAPDPAHP